MTTSDTKRPRGRPWLAAVVGTAIACGIGAAIVIPRIERARASREERARRTRIVETVIVQAAPWSINLALAGTATPLATLQLHAQAIGSVSAVNADLGVRVSKGQVLATVTLAEPLIGPTPTGDRADEIVAPFDGVITRRNVEVGDEVDPAAMALFEVADTSALKVYIDVPQTLAPWVRVGESVAVTARAVSFATITGAVARTAGALDPTSHTMRVEVHFPGERLLAGSAVMVRFAVQREITPPMIPARALVFGSKSPRVVRLVDGRAHYATIELGWDRGGEIEIASGVEVGDVIVTSPPENVREGEPLAVNEATASL